MAKFGIGFYDDFEAEKFSSEEKNMDNSKAKLYDHINRYLLCNLKIKIGSKLSDFLPLIHAGRHLANAYFGASFKKGGKRTFDKKINEELISRCEPIIIAQLDSSKFNVTCLSNNEETTPDLLDKEVRFF
jgi:hypothetical protein